jgi:hypothetical protein
MKSTANEYMIVDSDVLIERDSQTEIFCLMPNMFSTFIRVHLVHHNCITAITKLLSEKSQINHDDYYYVTCIRHFPLKWARPSTSISSEELLSHSITGMLKHHIVHVFRRSNQLI